MDNPPKDKASNTEDMESDNHPSPMDFDVYLPYACSQLQVEAVIVVTKVVQQEYVSISAMSEKSKSKQKGKQPKMPSHQDLDSDQERDEKSVSPSVEDEENVINILAVYDANDNLVQLKFDKNKNIPRTVLRIIGLVIQYQRMMGILGVKPTETKSILN